VAYRRASAGTVYGSRSWTDVKLLSGWRKLHNEELNDLYSSPNIIRLIKSRIIRWAGHVARMGESKVHTGFLWGGLRESDHLGDPGVDETIILKWAFKEWDGAWTGLRWLRLGRGGGLL
jgi:hypothetical protein